MMRVTSWRWLVYPLFAAVAICLIQGCGRRADFDGVVRGDAIEGQVYYDGQPLPSGTIKFSALNLAEPQQFDINDGYFKGRISPGKKLIEVIATRPVPGKFGPSGEPVLKQYLPPYFPLTGMMANIKADGTDDPIEIDLLSERITEDMLKADPYIQQRLYQKNHEHRLARVEAKKAEEKKQ